MTVKRTAAVLAGVTALTSVVALTGACTGGPSDTAPRPSASPSRSSVTRAPSAGPLPTAGPATMDVDPRRLAALADDAEDAGSSCFLVVRRGHVVGQWYWRGATPHSSREVFSVTKSVASTLVGIAADDGLLDVDASASLHVPSWRGTDAADVSVRNLLSNDSGREWSTSSDYTGLLRSKDRTAYAVGLPQQHPPGTVWAYNNSAIQTLDAVLVDATGRRTAWFARDRLFAPLGMSDTRLTNGGGTSTNLAFGMHSTCPDLARFGLLFAQGGRWDGSQVVSAAWVKAATGAPSQDLNAAYGYLWWLNREGALRTPRDEVDGLGAPVAPRQGRLVPSAPGDLFAALGFGGQVVLVHPSTGTVVVRLGDPADVRGSADYTVADAARVLTEALKDG